MWVTKLSSAGSSFLTGCGRNNGSLLHTLSHRLKGLNSPLTWGYLGFPQATLLVTTTTYRYIDQPVRFPILTFLKLNYLKIKTCKVLQVREG